MEKHAHAWDRRQMKDGQKRQKEKQMDISGRRRRPPLQFFFFLFAMQLSSNHICIINVFIKTWCVSASFCASICHTDQQWLIDKCTKEEIQQSGPDLRLHSQLGGRGVNEYRYLNNSSSRHLSSSAHIRDLSGSWREYSSLSRDLRCCDGAARRNLPLAFTLD